MILFGHGTTALCYVMQWVLTEDDACHGGGQCKLLLEVFSAERHESVDHYSIKHAI